MYWIGFMSIKVKFPHTMGWVESKLDKSHMDFLWDKIREGKKKNINHKNELVGHLSNSFEIEDTNDWFMQNALFQNIDAFFKTNSNNHPVTYYSPTEDLSQMGIKLGRMWVNYQFQTEFNPYHNHSGVYSFVIWMKIPYSCEEQKKLSFLDGMKDKDKKAGIFEFEYLDILGRISNHPYYMEPELEGTMLFFPAALKHCVYPFYDCYEPRISISGNLYMVPNLKPPEPPKLITNTTGLSKNYDPTLMRKIING
tara:strand:- start:52 stop:810 length:759 start_codon:yes stop_codon:yes gene_type:complete